MSSTSVFRSDLIENPWNGSEIVHNDTDFTPEIFPSDAGGYHLNYNSHPRPEKYTGIQGNLRSTLEIPAVFRHIFSQYTTFNQIQSNIFDDAFYSDAPLVVSAPTGSGKTVIFELAIIRSLMNLEDLDRKDFKIIYLAPLKALCHERLVDWQIKFNHLGVSCVEATGDNDISELTELAKYKIIITTPEKWDTLTRRWKDFQSFVSEITLFLIDEIHLVNENERGATLEVILSRMKTISSTLKYNKSSPCNVNLRFVGVSATLPNIEDVAIWIGGADAKFYKMPEGMRPIQLEKFVFGYPSNSYISYFRFDMSLNYKLGQLIQQYSGGKPTLIFCSTRRGVEMAAKVVGSSYSFITPRNSQAIGELVQRITDSKMAKLLSNGVAYHHGGLLLTDRVLIEEAFRNGSIPVLLCTSTLATGVNLPAHLVILKSTQVYSQTGTDEYPESLIFQMIGRAGRPQYDNSGVAIIMTQHNKVKLYENMVSGIRPIESNLHKHLPEHLNAEIVLRTITDLGVAVQWIKSTFLYVRAIKNPSHYGFPSSLNKEKVEQKLEELCLIAINSLEKHKLLTKDQLYGLTITSTVAGKLMARCYLNFNTMKIFQQMTGNDGLIDLMLLISNCHEFNEYKLRTSDKRYLNELNTSKTNPLRFPVKGRVKTISDKIFILLQAVLGNISCSEQSLYQETTKIIRTSEKIAKAMVQYIALSELNLTSKQFKTVYSALILSKCCAAKMWENSPYVSKQLNKIGNTYSKLLVEAGKTTFESIYESSARELETILHRAPPMGNLIHEAINKLPYFNIDLSLVNTNFCRVKVRQTNKNCMMGRNCYEKISVIVGDSKNNLLFLKENISYFLMDNKEFDKNIKFIDLNAEVITAHVIHSTLVGLDKRTQLCLQPPQSESQAAFKPKPPVVKKTAVKNKFVPKKPTPQAIQPINPNSTSVNINQTNSDLNHDCDYNQIHDNHNDDKDQNNVDYFDIEISQQQMIFNKCRDQGIDHDRNKNLTNSNVTDNSNTTLLIDGNRTASTVSTKSKFIKKTRITKTDFTTTTIVPSLQSQEKTKLSPQNKLENENEMCTKLSNGDDEDDDYKIYRIVEILEKNQNTSDQRKSFENKCTKSNVGNGNNVLHTINHIDDHVREQYYNNTDENRLQTSIKIVDDDDDVRNNQKNNLNVINLKVAAKPVVENDFDICVEDRFKPHPSLSSDEDKCKIHPSLSSDEDKCKPHTYQSSQLKIYSCSSPTNRQIFPSTQTICKRQRSMSNKPFNYGALLKSICDADAFSGNTDIVNSELLNLSVIEEDINQNKQPEIDYKMLMSQQKFMAECESPCSNKEWNSPPKKENNSSHLNTIKESVDVRRPMGVKDKLKSYDYELVKKPKIDKQNLSIMNFIDHDDAQNMATTSNEYRKFNRVSSNNPLITSYKQFYEPSSSSTVQRNFVNTPSPHITDNDNYKTPPNNQYRILMSPTPLVNSSSNFVHTSSPHIKDNDNYKTPPNNKYRILMSPSPFVNHHQTMPIVFNESYSESDDDDNTNENLDNGFCDFIKKSQSQHLFSQTNSFEMEMWEKDFLF